MGVPSPNCQRMPVELRGSGATRSSWPGETSASTKPAASRSSRGPDAADSTREAPSNSNTRRLGSSVIKAGAWVGADRSAVAR